MGQIVRIPDLNMKESFLHEIVRELREGKTILYPTDTVWGLGCDAWNDEAVNKVFEIKQRSRNKAMIILVSSVAMLHRYTDLIPDIVHNSADPVTMIYESTHDLPKHLLSDDGSVAIRIVRHPEIARIIEALGRPIISTSANVSGESPAQRLSDVNPRIKKEVDIVFPESMDIYGRSIPSSIYKVAHNGTLIQLR